MCSKILAWYKLTLFYPKGKLTAFLSLWFEVISVDLVDETVR